jgi:hypothetical protein
MNKISRKLAIPVKALETTFRLKTLLSSLGCYLHVTQDEVPKDLSGGCGEKGVGMFEECPTFTKYYMYDLENHIE